LSRPDIQIITGARVRNRRKAATSLSRTAASALLRKVTSRMITVNNLPSPVLTWEMGGLDGEFLAVRPQPEQGVERAHGEIGNSLLAKMANAAARVQSENAAG